MIALMNMHASPAVGTADYHRHTTCTAEMPSHTLSILISANSDTSQTNPTIPRSHKAVTKESCIDCICNFFDTCICPTDLSNTDYKSFINAATRFFILNDTVYYHKLHGRHQLVVPIVCHYRLIQEAHNSLRHKGIFSIHMHLLLRFWWLMLVDNVKWYIKTCHKCQIWQTEKLHIPSIIPIIGGLFHKVHIDTMVMPCSGRYHFIVQAQCALTAYPEWHMLCSENVTMFMLFIFEDILCCWGVISELVTDNRTPYIQALDILTNRYRIHHIHISPYNSQANGMVEQHHYNVQETIIKSTLGREVHWLSTTHSVFWAECITILKTTGLLPYFMVHGIELLFPFDLMEVTFLVPTLLSNPISTNTLIVWQACQLQKRLEDIDHVQESIHTSRFAFHKEFENRFKNQIHDYDFGTGNLVLVWNLWIKKELNWKMRRQSSKTSHPQNNNNMRSLLCIFPSQVLTSVFLLILVFIWSHNHSHRTVQKQNHQNTIDAHIFLSFPSWFLLSHLHGKTC